MRLRDLKVQVGILIFLMVCFLGCTFVYQMSLNNLTLDNALIQTESYLNASNAKLEGTISKYESEFAINNTSYEIVTGISGFESKFENDEYSLIASQMEIEGSGDGYYLYIYIENTLARVALTQVFERAFDDKITTLLVLENEIVYTNLPLRTTSFETAITAYNNEDTLTSLNGSTPFISGSMIDFASFEETESRDAIKGYFGVVEIDGFKLVRFLTDNNISQANSNITKIKYAYFAGICLIVVLAFITMSSVIRKATKHGGTDLGQSRSNNIILSVNSKGKIIKYNKPFRLSFPNNQVPVKGLSELVLIGSDEELSTLIKNQKSFKMMYKYDVDPEDEENYKKIIFEFLSLKHASDYNLVGREMTEEYAEEQALVNVSTKSQITGDDNAFILGRKYREVKAKFKQNNLPYTLAIFNLRGFKDVNMLLGFKAGNEVLHFFSDRLHESFQDEMIFHIGADEFVILVQKPDAEELPKIDKFVDSLRAPIKIRNNEIMLRPAVGILASDMDGAVETTYEELIEKLRIAKDKAKSVAGKSIVKYDTNLENAALKTREMEEDLKQAISKNEFVMFYQPQYDINQDRICGFEALLRWNNPKYAGISPQVYIEMAEKNGFIIDVGNFINQDVFKTAKEMEQYDIHISVNVSPAQIVQAGFVADLLNEFEKNKLQPGSIAVEVTETFLMENFQAVIEKLKILKSRGVSIHLDDFGTGYSSMLYLKELPIDTIKVDKEFIKHIETDRFSKVLTSKIITLAKELGDKVICEGVETKIQKDIVGKFGADIIQGYYIGKALSKEDAFALLKTGKISTENKSNGKVGE